MTTVKEVTTSSTTTVVINIEDGPLMSPRYGYKDKQFPVDTIVTSWYRSNQEPWHLSRTEAYGTLPKKNGTPGLLRASSDFYRTTETPAWLSELVEQHRPI